MDDHTPKLTLIRALSYDIQGSYRPCEDRLNALIELCIEVNQPQWAQLLQIHSLLIYEDGRWFRGWPGPCGEPDRDDILDLNYELLKEYWDLFHYPETSVGFSSLDMFEYVQDLRNDKKHLEVENQRLELEKQIVESSKQWLELSNQELDFKNQELIKQLNQEEQPGST